MVDMFKKMTVSYAAFCLSIVFFMGCEEGELFDERQEIAITTSSQALYDTTDFLFVSDVTQCTNTTYTNAMNVYNLALSGSKEVLMTEGNNCTSTSPDPYYRDWGFDDIWGDDLDRIHPVPGNHDYMTGIQYYQDYFDDLYGHGSVTPNNDNWAIIRLDSNYPESSYGGMSDYWWYEQMVTVSNALYMAVEYEGKQCVLVYCHFPRYSTGPHGNISHDRMVELWELFYQYKVDLVLSGHDHDYERFYPMDAHGNRDDTDGIVQIVDGTGGATLSSSWSRSDDNSAYRKRTSHGLVEIDLQDTAFRTVFRSTSGNTYDYYTRNCTD